MKRSAKIYILVGALAVCVGLYFLVSALSKEQTAKEADKAADTTDLAAGESSDITALSWTYKGDTVSLTHNADSDTWSSDSDAACPIDPDKVKTMLEAVSTVSADASIESVTDFSQYGLDKQDFIITASTADVKTEYDIGNTNTITGEYYIRVNGGDTVYTVASTLPDAFSFGLADIVKMEAVPSDIKTVTGVSVDTIGTKAELTYLEDSTGVCYTDQYHWFTVNGGTYTPLDTDSVKTLYETITKIEWNSCVAWNATDADLAGYGLNNPQGRVSIAYTGSDGAAHEFTILFGNYSGTSVYAQIEGSRMVYLVDGTVLDGFMFADLATMAAKNVCLVDTDTVTDVDVTLGGATYNLAKGSETVTPTAAPASPSPAATAAETGTETQTEEVTTWTSGGTSLDADKVNAWLSQIYALSSDGNADGDAGRQLEMSVAFHRSSADYKEITLDFYTYSSAECVCVFNGSTRTLVSRASVEDMIQDVNEFLNLTK